MNGVPLPVTVVVTTLCSSLPNRATLETEICNIDGIRSDFRKVYDGEATCKAEDGAVVSFRNAKTDAET